MWEAASLVERGGRGIIVRESRPGQLGQVQNSGLRLLEKWALHKPGAGDANGLLLRGRSKTRPGTQDGVRSKKGGVEEGGRK